MFDSVPRWQLSLSWPIKSDHLSISDLMILPLEWEHSHGKKQYIPGKQVLVKSWLWKNNLACCILCLCKCPHITHFKTQCHHAPFPPGRLTEPSLTRDYCKTSSKDTEKKEIHKESNFRAMLIRIEMASKKYCGMSVAVLYYYVLLLCSWYC